MAISGSTTGVTRFVSPQHVWQHSKQEAFSEDRLGLYSTVGQLWKGDPASLVCSQKSRAAEFLGDGATTQPAEQQAPGKEELVANAADGLATFAAAGYSVPTDGNRNREK